MKWRDAMSLSIEASQNLGAEQCDVLYSSTSSEDIEVFQGEVTKAEASSGQGLGVRLLKNGRPGYAYTRKISETSIRQMVQDAVDHSVLSDPIDLQMPKSLSKNNDEELGKWSEELEQLSLSELKDLALQLEEQTRTFHTDIENVPHAGVGKNVSHSALLNHHGLFFESRSNVASGYVSAVAQKNGQRKTGGYGDGGRHRTDLDVAKWAQYAGERSLELLGAKPIERGEFPVVFSNRITASLLGMFLGSLTADQVQKGQSRLEGKINEKIASDCFSLICEPHLKERPGSRFVDSEGVETQQWVLVDQGVLKTFLHNLETSAKDGHLSTGHGSRGLRGRAGIGFSNLTLPLGKDSLDNLLSVYPKCLYVSKLEGGAACSAVSGDLSIGVQGFWVENGNIVHPVDSITVNGNFFDLIKNIESVSNETNEVFSSMKIPDFLVKSLTISG